MNKIVILLLLISNQVLSQNLKLASDVWPPFTDVRDNTHYATDIVETAITRLGYGAESIIIDFGDVVSGIGAKEYDGSAALWISESRKEFLIFSEPYLENRLMLVGKKGSFITYNSLSEIKGKKIGLVKNYEYGKEIEDLKTVSFLYGNSDQECLNLLLGGRVDYILLDDLLVQQLEEYQQQNVSRFLAISQNPLLIKPLHFALNKSVENAEIIINQFNNEVIEMQKDGTYHALLNLNWISADVDGDGVNEQVLGSKNAGLKPPDNLYNIIMNNPVPDSGSAQEYYIQGKQYNGWNAVPDQYKLKPINNTNDVNILNFNLNKK